MNQNKELEKSLFSKKNLMLEKEAKGTFYDSVRSYCCLKKGQKVLDVGCGTGVFGIDMAKQGGEIIGLDISPEAIRFANHWAKKKDLTFKGLVGDAENLPFKDNSFDLVFFGAVLHHFPNPEKAICEAERVLKNGGRLVLVEPNGNNPILQLSRFLARFLANKYAEEILATKNETIHSCPKYIKFLKKKGFGYFQIMYLKKLPAHKKIFTKNIFLRIAIKLKIFALWLIAWTLPAIGFGYILVLALKRKTVDKKVENYE